MRRLPVYLVLNLYSARTPGSFTPDQHRIMVNDGIRLYPWHVSGHVHANECLSDAQKQPQALPLRHGQQILLGDQPDARLIAVQMVNV